MLYTHILKPLLFRFDPEDVHEFFVDVGAGIGALAPARWLTDLVYGYHGLDISKTVDGIRYRTPFILSAGFDYNGHLTKTLKYIGLGGEEVGSVTARPCHGNPSPRLKRLPKSRSILVNKGLKNDGVDTIIERLRSSSGQRRGDDFVVGVSIARTNDRGSTSIEEGIADYLYSFKRLNEEGIGDYYTINISCPNAFGGEAFIKPELLTKLLLKLREVNCDRPVYVKMPINIPWGSFRELLTVIDEAGLQGVIIGNLNKDYGSLMVRDEAPQTYRGGLSGMPCDELSTNLIRLTRQEYGRRFTIIGAGGVMSPETMGQKLEAGADLIQLITGLIFEGPGLVKRLCRAYAQMPRWTGVQSDVYVRM